ncbi:unnamed protein product [Mucor hiemalis]
MQKVTGVGRKASWLFNDKMYKDGAFRFITALDPLFMGLPILEHASKEGKFKTLDDIFSRENVTLEVEVDNEHELTDALAAEYEKPVDVHRLTNIPGFVEQLAHFCDIQEIASNLLVYKLNQDMVLQWLEKKVDLIASNEAFRKSFESAEKEESQLKLEAVYTLSNYLNKEWFSRLLVKLELSEGKEEVELGDITNYATDASPMSFFKRTYSEDAFLDEAPAKKKKPAVPKSLAKVNVRGMKSLTSFFAKK